MGGHSGGVGAGHIRGRRVCFDFFIHLLFSGLAVWRCVDRFGEFNGVSGRANSLLRARTSPRVSLAIKSQT